MAFSDPIATTSPPFTVASGAHSIAPHTYFSYTGSRLLPTNAWWQNLLITHVDSGNYNGKCATFPYAQWPATSGKGVLFAYHGTEGRSVASNAITLSSVTEVSLEMNEALTAREITDYSDLGVSLRFSHSGGSMASHLVQGQAFNSGNFTSATPVIKTDHPILLINGASPVSSLTNVTKFKVRTSYFDRDWLVYASQPISVSISGQTITATAPFSGFIQVAHLPSGANEAAYDTGSTALLTGGSVSATFSGDTANQVFTFTSTGSGSPLVFALPHHQDLMPSATYAGIQLLSMKGTMKAISANSWTLSETLPVISWNATNPIPGSVVSDIQAALTIEKNSTHDSVGNGWGMSPYYGGKYVAKMARMILIAEEVGDNATASSIATSLKNFMSTYLTATPTGSPGVDGSGYVNTLIYQGGATWRGISTQNGLADMGADFGNGRFNDHHFHYGYWIYAAAVVARNDTTWRDTHKDIIESLIRDIANPSTSDTYFPKFRHKDWFAGHSWAGGLVGIDVGPGQESTSEAINAWYGVHLWGLANGNTELSNLGRLLLASEVRSAKRYWHMYENSDIYESTFSNHPASTAVIVRSHKVAIETYFGSQPHFFVGIELMPFTPISETYIDAPWVQRSYTYASSNIPTTTSSNPMDNGWDSVIYSMHAVIDADAAYAEASALTLEQIPEYDTFVQYGRRIDNGHSKANALWWAATRSGFTSGGGGGGGGSGTPGPASSNASSTKYMSLARSPINTLVRNTTATNYTIVTADHTVAFRDITAARTVTLPSSAQFGRVIVVKDETGSCSGANTITVVGTIDGQANLILNSAYAVARVYFNGISWSRIY